jgi:hypothetical protein
MHYDKSPQIKLLAEISFRAQERANKPLQHEHSSGTADLQCELCNGYRERFEAEFKNDERTPELLKLFRATGRTR